MPPLIRHLSPVEAARRLGVSVKALRLYEAKGLVRPMRDGNGWRVYGPDAMARIHQVLALKRMGLPLQRIAALLEGRRLGLAEVLELQERQLGQEARRLDRALDLVRAARRRLDRGEALSIDDLATLTHETTMTDTLSAEDWRAIFDPLARKHYTADQLQALEARWEEGVDEAEIQRLWAETFAEVRALMAEGVSPDTPPAMSLARRWKMLQDRFTQGDAQMAESARTVWTEAMTDPDAAAKLPVTPQMFAWIGQAAAAVRAAGVKP